MFPCLSEISNRIRCLTEHQDTVLVAIEGSCTAGKTTLARQLGEKTGLPVVHLDQIFWSPGNWKHLEREEFDALLQKELEKKGVTFLLSHKCLAVEEGKVVAEAPNGEKVEIPADKVLLSIGRRANIQGIGLENIGVETNRAGIIVDNQGRTNVEGVFAAGDCNGHVMLAHTAYREAEVCVNTILGKKDTMRYHANPSVIYTQPEIAACGLTEEEAKAQGIDYEVKKLSMRYSGRFVAARIITPELPSKPSISVNN